MYKHDDYILDSYICTHLVHTDTGTSKICGRKIGYHDGIRRHLVENHSDFRHYRCQFCISSYKKRKNLLYHELFDDC